MHSLMDFREGLFSARTGAASQNAAFGIYFKKYAINGLNPWGIPQTAWIMRGIHNRHKQAQNDVCGQYHYVRYIGIYLNAQLQTRYLLH